MAAIPPADDGIASAAVPYLGGYPRRSGFTLLELLVVVGIMGVLMGLLFPALGRARTQSKQAKCLSNLHALGRAASAYASEDPREMLLPAHPISDINPLHDEGFFDYGGVDGASNVWNGERYGPGSARRGATRPLNPYVDGTGSAKDGASVFRCPDDEALPSIAADSEDMWWAPAMQQQSMYESVGTSYSGNGYRGYEADPKKPRDWFSVGPFLRPSSAITTAPEVLLFYEAVMWHNVTRDPSRKLFRWLGLRGWHDEKPRYTAAFCDGHAAVVTAPAGPMVKISSSPPDEDGLALRGPGFRFDCHPAPLILDLPRAIRRH